MTLSAKGTRLNRRGLETRTQLLETAVACLSTGGPESVSANLIARRAGVTWGTVQHQFGDADGLWAAVLDHIESQFEEMAPVPPAGHTVSERVHAIVELLWQTIDRPGSHAIYTIRGALPRQQEDLEAAFPRSAKALATWHDGWTAACDQAFADLPVDPERLRKVVSLLPGAMMGLRNEQHLATYTDLDAARAGLAEALATYLAAPSGTG